MSKKNRFEIRLTDKENAQLKAKALKAGVRRATLLRNYIANRPIMDMELATEIRKLTVEISRIGNNINQIARRWNESGSDMRDLAFIDQYLNEILGDIKEVKEYCYSTHSSERR